MRFRDLSFTQLERLYNCVDRMIPDTVDVILDWTEYVHAELIDIDDMIEVIENSPVNHVII